MSNLLKFSPKIYLLPFCILLTFHTVECSEVSEKIEKADRYFAQRKYTESLEIYEAVFTQDKQASPHMLIRMAFIQEGLGNYTKALYYLNLYYRYAPNNKTLIHMERLAHEERLKGYEHSDLDFIRALYDRYFVMLALFIVICASGAFAYLVIRRVQNKPVSLPYQLILLLFLSLTFFLITYNHEGNYAIICRNQTYLMQAPSAGAEVRAIVKAGHRVKFLKKEDIWYQIQWEGKEAYVRAASLWLVE